MVSEWVKVYSSKDIHRYIRICHVSLLISNIFLFWKKLEEGSEAKIFLLEPCNTKSGPRSKISVSLGRISGSFRPAESESTFKWNLQESHICIVFLRGTILETICMHHLLRYLLPFHNRGSFKWTFPRNSCSSAKVLV